MVKGGPEDSFANNPKRPGNKILFPGRFLYPNRYRAEQLKELSREAGWPECSKLFLILSKLMHLLSASV